ncbi:MAG: hypothetical protein ACOCP8_02435 [archaeon]
MEESSKEKVENNQFLVKKEKEIKRIFNKKLRMFSFDVELDLKFIKKRPIVDENVYGEAFPEEKRVKLEVFIYDISIEEIKKIICHELLHIKYPDLSHNDDKFEEELNKCLDNSV